MNAPTTPSIARGAVITVASRWLSRLIGLLSTLVLARLLVPEDFGIAAMASLGVGLATTLFDVGVNVALIRNTNATAEHYHSAWTLRLLQAAAVMVALVAAAPLAADWFKDERVGPVMAVMALNVLLAALENIRIVDLQKHMRFGHELRYLLINRVVGLVCGVVLAYTLRSYWALVLASTLSTLFMVAHSYIAVRARPRLAFGRCRELMAVSQWMLVQNISGWFDLNLHRIVVGRRDETAVLGAYSLAAEIAALPSTEVLQPLNRALFPAFVAAKHDLARLKQTFLLAQAIQVALALPAAVLLAVMADEVVALMLGPKWTAAAPFLRVLSLGYAFSAMQSSAWYVSLTLGRERYCAGASWLQVLVFVVGAWVVFPSAHALELAWLRVGVSGLGLGLQLWIAAAALGNVRLADLLRGTWRTVLATLVVVALGMLVPWHTLQPLWLLPAKAVFHVGGFVAALWLLWRACGCPEGAEHYLAARLAATLPIGQREAAR